MVVPRMSVRRQVAMVTVCHWDAALVAVTLVASLGISFETFDVSAFFQGLSLEGSVRVRAPCDGSLAVGTLSKVRPRQLIQVLKGVYGLTETPRLWYVRSQPAE